MNNEHSTRLKADLLRLNNKTIELSGFGLDMPPEKIRHRNRERHPWRCPHPSSRDWPMQETRQDLR